jgi:hypothetical protein
MTHSILKVSILLINLQTLHGWASSGEEAGRYRLHLRIFGFSNFLHCTLLHGQRMCIVSLHKNRCSHVFRSLRLIKFFNRPLRLKFQC